MAQVQMAAFAQQGHPQNAPVAVQEGHGGDREGLWFTNHAALAIAYFKGICAGSKGDRRLNQELPGAACADFDAIKKVLRTTSVTFEDHVYGQDGAERDAINNGVDHITVSRARWNEMKKASVYQRIRIALHEYASIAKVEGSDAYGFSSGLEAQLPLLESIQPQIDRIRFSVDYLLSLEGEALVRLVAGFSQSRSRKERARMPSLFGACSLILEKDPRGGQAIRLYLNGVEVGTSWSEIDITFERGAAGFRKLLSEGKCI